MACFRFAFDRGANRHRLFPLSSRGTKSRLLKKKKRLLPTNGGIVHATKNADKDRLPVEAPSFSRLDCSNKTHSISLTAKHTLQTHCVQGNELTPTFNPTPPALTVKTFCEVTSLLLQTLNKGCQHQTNQLFCMLQCSFCLTFTSQKTYPSPSMTFLPRTKGHNKQNPGKLAIVLPPPFACELLQPSTFERSHHRVRF